MQSFILISTPCQLYIDGMMAHLHAAGYVLQCSYANDESQLLQLVADAPALVVLGPHWSPRQAFRLLRILRRLPACPKVLIMCERVLIRSVQLDAAALGASACLPHDISGEALTTAISTVLAGQTLFAPDILQRAYRSIELTMRQLEVVALWATGKTDKEVADELTISVKTVYRHAADILAKFKPLGRDEVIIMARHRGWIGDL